MSTPWHPLFAQIVRSLSSDDLGVFLRTLSLKEFRAFAK